MKYIIIAFLSTISFTIMAQSETTMTKTADTQEKIQWMSWDEAYAANKITPKKIFVDIYTDWCGWCKKMDATTFQDQNIIKEINDSFYPVKFDAEMKDDITFNDAVFKHVNQGRNGTHQLAFALLDGRMGFPAFVMLDESFSRVMLVPGYKTAEQLITQLKYTSTDAYKTQNFDAFSKADD